MELQTLLQASQPPNLQCAMELATLLEPQLKRQIGQGGRTGGQGGNNPRCTDCGRWKNAGHRCRPEDVAAQKKCNEAARKPSIGSGSDSRGENRSSCFGQRCMAAVEEADTEWEDE